MREAAYIKCLEEAYRAEEEVLRAEEHAKYTQYKEEAVLQYLKEERKQEALRRHDAIISEGAAVRAVSSVRHVERSLGALLGAQRDIDNSYIQHTADRDSQDLLLQSAASYHSQTVQNTTLAQARLQAFRDQNKAVLAQHSTKLIGGSLS
eukprot:TRINITY_DN12764_c0_g1_i1.p1 TRINITY_DN12764_c0_g1~~TRINITY_DN12764_c0_g1_i1.p1  ORF type:complete len:150 (+),score=30.48 TRINITY_DN12764_c0_g1_i1:52-501(+)